MFFYLNTHYSPIYRPAVSNKLVPPLIFQLSPKGFYNSGYNVKLKLLYSEIQDDSFCISSSVFVFVFVKETVISFAGRLFFLSQILFLLDHQNQVMCFQLI